MKGILGIMTRIFWILGLVATILLALSVSPAAAGEGGPCTKHADCGDPELRCSRKEGNITCQRTVFPTITKKRPADDPNSVEKRKETFKKNNPSLAASVQ